MKAECSKKGKTVELRRSAWYTLNVVICVAKYEQKEILYQVYAALQERGYNPAGQLVGFILSEDPTYITTHNNARILVRRINRNELLQEIVENYFAEDCGVKPVTPF